MITGHYQKPPRPARAVRTLALARTASGRTLYLVLAGMSPILGPLVVLAGAFAEGETVLVAAGFAVHRGYLPLAPVAIAAFLGTFAGDQLYFHLGRRYGTRILERRPRWKSHVDRLRGSVARHATAIALGFRFWIGIRIAAPIALGISGMRPWRFALLNAISGAVWTTVVLGAGILFGQAAERLVGPVRRYDLAIVGGLAGVALLLWAGRRWYRSHHPR